MSVRRLVGFIYQVASRDDDVEWPAVRPAIFSLVLSRALSRIFIPFCTRRSTFSRRRSLNARFEIRDSRETERDRERSSVAGRCATREDWPDKSRREFFPRQGGALAADSVSYDSISAGSINFARAKRGERIMLDVTPLSCNETNERNFIGGLRSPARPSVRPSARPPVRPSVRPSARPSARPSVRPSVRSSIRTRYYAMKSSCPVNGSASSD